MNFPVTGHDWPEDFAEENGQYQNTCCKCSAMFVGNKRRNICKVCVTEFNKDRTTKGDTEMSVCTNCQSDKIAGLPCGVCGSSETTEILQLEREKFEKWQNTLTELQWMHESRAQLAWLSWLASKGLKE